MILAGARLQPALVHHRDRRDQSERLRRDEERPGDHLLPLQRFTRGDQRDPTRIFYSYSKVRLYLPKGHTDRFRPI